MKRFMKFRRTKNCASTAGTI